ncbi:HAD hydrolase family protein [Brevibacillus sp. NPDC003359]|uniref:HAD hydrolase family protein n=1 Tax=unclassified Brevibacillus TaxID=2684853 RepID=UPI00367662A3
MTDWNDSEPIINKFGDQVNIMRTDDGKLIQIMSVKASKENAVNYLIESQGNKMSDVMCFGDDFNDNDGVAILLERILGISQKQANL